MRCPLCSESRSRSRRRRHRPRWGGAIAAPPDLTDQVPDQAAGRLALKAAWNSEWSLVVISNAWVIASSSIAADKGMSCSRVSSAFVWA